MNASRLPLLIAPLLLFATSPLQADVVLDWNRIASDVFRDDTTLQNPGMASRSMAMMNLAIYDAFQMTAPTGSMFYDYGGGHASPGYTASSKAAATQAAYTVLSTIYDLQYATLGSGLSASLAAIPDGAAKTEGIALGTMIGQSIINRRQNDGYISTLQYMPTDEVGHWQPDPLNPDQEAWGPAWGDVDTFMLTSGKQIMPPPMPDLTSQEYADAFNEVKDLGALNSPNRTAEQTEIGNFWAYDRGGMGTPMRMFNNILQTIAVQEGNTVKENAELFAKASVAIADAGITAWNSKFEYDFWRPITGIRQADQDGNPLTEADPDWTPLGAPGGEDTNFTPPFPTYLSGHATFGGALFQTLADFYGTDEMEFTLTSEELPGVEREFTTLSQAMAENGRSRVYLGIHWNFDDTVAQVTGAEVARYITGNAFLAAIPEPGSLSLVLFGAALATVRRRRVTR